MDLHEDRNIVCTGKQQLKLIKIGADVNILYHFSSYLLWKRGMHVQWRMTGKWWGKRVNDKAQEKGRTREGLITSVLRVQSFFPTLTWRLADIVLDWIVWVEVAALTIVRYINRTVIIPLRLLGSLCSCQDAAPYKCTGLPRVPGNSKQMSQNTALSISQDRWESLFNQCCCKSGVPANYSIPRQASRE